MAKLVVRKMGIRDILRVPNVRQSTVDVSLSGDRAGKLQILQRRLSGSLPDWKGSTVGIVALVDGELCSYLLMQKDEDRYAWNVLTMASGSGRVDATSEVSIELWTAMLEYGIKEAGRQGIRRLMALPPEGSLAQSALERSGFVAYSRIFVLRGTLDTERNGMRRLREQHDSDIWSIHQIYNRTTPRPVQFAEARTSDWWQLDDNSRLPGATRNTAAFVLDAPDGIDFYCRISGRAHPTVMYMVAPNCGSSVVSLVSEAIEGIGLAGREIDICVPAYHQEHIEWFREAGFWIDCERIAMVRHTTVHRVVHAAFAQPAGEASRVSRARGVPTLVRGRVWEN